MGGVAGLTGDGRWPMGGEGGPRRSRAAPEHDIIQFARRSQTWWGRGRGGGGAGEGAAPGRGRRRRSPSPRCVGAGRC